MAHKAKKSKRKAETKNAAMRTKRKAKRAPVRKAKAKKPRKAKRAKAEKKPEAETTPMMSGEFKMGYLIP
jgi:hypothetical protein